MLLYALQLAAILIALTIGHRAVRDSDRILFHILRSLFYWLLALAAIAYFELHSRPLVMLIEAALAGAILYGLFRLAQALIRRLQHVPYLPHPTRKDIAHLLMASGYGKRDAFAEIKQLKAEGHSLAIIAAAAVEAVTQTQLIQELHAFMQEQCLRQKQAADALLAAIQPASQEQDYRDRMFVENLVLRGGVPWASAAAKSAGRKKDKDIRRELVASLPDTADDAQYADALAYFGIDLNVKAKKETTAWDRLGNRALVATALPAYAFLELGQPRRAVLFLLCYAPTLAYGIARIAGHHSEGWVFAAVAVFLHLSALLNLDITCREAE